MDLQVRLIASQLEAKRVGRYTPDRLSSVFFAWLSAGVEYRSDKDYLLLRIYLVNNQERESTCKHFTVVLFLFWIVERIIYNGLDFAVYYF